MIDQSALLTQLVASAAQVALVVVLARLLGATVLGASARLLASRACGRGHADALAQSALRLSPRCTRRAVAALAGAGLALALTGPAAVADTNPRSMVPVLDRVIAPVLDGSSAGWRDAPRPRHTEAAGAHVVRPGDSLWSVAAAELGADATPTQVARSWPRWFDRNRGVIGPDPAHLVPGQLLQPPRSATATGTESR